MRVFQAKKIFSALMIAGVTVVGAIGCSDDEDDIIDTDAVTTAVIPAVTDAVAPDALDAVADAAAPFTPETVYFAFDDYSLAPAAQERLTRLAEHLRNNTGSVLQVEGHCDERGSIEYNLALGERRAQSVKSYLIQLGVQPTRLTTISYGEEKPALEGHHEAAWSQNRRAEFILSSQ